MSPSLEIDIRKFEPPALELGETVVTVESPGYVVICAHDLALVQDDACP